MSPSEDATPGPEVGNLGSLGRLMPRLSRRETYREAQSMVTGPSFNLFSIFVPLGIGAALLDLPAQLVFWLNWLAIIPLAPIAMMAILKLSIDLGQIKGGLLKAILGNSAEMAICLVAVTKNLVALVRSMIIGIVLSYSLLLLGGSYLVAAYGINSVSFNHTQTSMTSALMMAVAISLVVPTIVTLSEDQAHRQFPIDSLMLSRSIAILILCLFVAYLIFRFQTHTSVFAIPRAEDETSLRRTSAVSGNQPRLSRILQLSMLYLAALTCVVLCSMNMIASLKAMRKSVGITRSFEGVVLLPLACNLGKSTIIISHAYKGRINRAIRHVMTSILNTLLFITPFTVLFGWTIGYPVELEFSVFHATMLILSIIIMRHLLQSGKATYLEGAMLVGTYIIIAIAFLVVN